MPAFDHATFSRDVNGTTDGVRSEQLVYGNIAFAFQRRFCGTEILTGRRLRFGI